MPRSGLRSRPRAAIAWAVFGRAVARLPIRVRLPDGRRLGGGGAGTPEMTLHRPADFYARVGSSGLIGFGESYMAGDWDCDDLTGLLDRVRQPGGHAGAAGRCSGCGGCPAAGSPHAERPPVAGARRNITHHYDLSNELFALFLDETMTYSSALFETGAAGSADGSSAPASLAAAQRRKIDRLLDLARVGPGSRVLEIGTGWGELAIRAAAARRRPSARSRCREQQRALAARRIAERPGWPTGSASSCGTTATSTASTTRSCRWR